MMPAEVKWAWLGQTLSGLGAHIETIDDPAEVERLANCPHILVTRIFNDEAQTWSVGQCKNDWLEFVPPVGNEPTLLDKTHWVFYRWWRVPRILDDPYLSGFNRVNSMRRKSDAVESGLGESLRWHASRGCSLVDNPLPVIVRSPGKRVKPVAMVVVRDAKESE